MLLIIGFAETLAILGMPTPVRSTYRNTNNIFTENEIKLAEKQITKNRHKLFKRLQINPYQKFHKVGTNSIHKISVKVDGSWTKAGFTSDYGIAVVLSTLTCDVLDYHVMSKYCNNCIKGLAHDNCKVRSHA